jgi:hypothetical protein
MSTKNQPTKRLSLDSETLRHLQSADLDKVAGGCDEHKNTCSQASWVLCNCQCGDTNVSQNGNCQTRK